MAMAMIYKSDKACKEILYIGGLRICKFSLERKRACINCVCLRVCLRVCKKNDRMKEIERLEKGKSVQRNQSISFNGFSFERLLFM